ncbi:glucose-6-phosphate isomerase, partial [Klebsiella michiganensis]|nr:glucose-6-phosphate isomerase [Klebsiella michiganensis]
ELFAHDSRRVATFSADVAGIRFDWSKTHLTADLVAAFTRIAAEMGLVAKRDALFAGEKVNVTEGRAVEHTAERGEGSPESVAR